jgi:pimeloyl-[acyl-carrier protein] synthase
MSQSHPNEQTRLFQPEMVADPYPVYARLRVTDPVYWDPASSSWVLTRYADVLAALQDPRLASGRAGAMNDQAGRPGLEPLFDFIGRMMPVTDPPRHTHLRGLVNKGFTPRAIEALEPFIRDLVAQLLDRVIPHGRMEVIGDFAFPLPAAVICQLLGVPVGDAERLKQLSDDLFLFIKGPLAATTEQEFATSVQAAKGFADYFRPELARRRGQPSADLLGALLRAEEHGERLTEDDLFANASLMLQAGHESTCGLIGNGVWALLQFPDQWQRLRDDPSLVPHAVEEFLRFDAPIHYIQRQAFEDLTIRSQLIRKGQLVSLMLGAANRDPDQFPDPDRLDVSRQPNKHLTFGLGHHFCLGAPLVRLEARIAFAELLLRLPKLRLGDGPPLYRNDFNLRGLRSLGVAF